MPKYFLEFILHIHSVSMETIKSSLIEFGDNLEIVELEQNDVSKGRNLKVHISSQDPTIIFDTCAQFGRIKSVKIKDQ